MSGQLDYWRADNMWAAAGRPGGDLGKESIALQMSQMRVFVTDWKYEKKRNDGSNYYGSHGRKLTNSGTVPIDIKLTGSVDASLKQYTSVTRFGSGSGLRLPPGVTVSIKNDIAEVSVPKT